MNSYLLFQLLGLLGMPHAAPNAMFQLPNCRSLLPANLWAILCCTIAVLTYDVFSCTICFTAQPKQDVKLVLSIISMCNQYFRNNAARLYCDLPGYNHIDNTTTLLWQPNISSVTAMTSKVILQATRVGSC